MNNQLLLLHGALGSRRQMEALEIELEKDYETLSLNLPGHGGRPIPDRLSMDLFVTDIAHTLQQKDTGPIDIFGFSMGGYVALLLAMSFPHLVRRVMTLGTKFDWTPETAERESLFLNPDSITRKVPSFAEMLAVRHAPQDWKLLVLNTKDLLMRLGNGEALIMSRFKLDHQVRILRGGMDHMVSAEESAFVANTLPNGQYEPVIGFRHPMEKIDPAILANRMREYFIE